LAAGAVALPLTLAACGGDEGEDGTIELEILWWGGPERAQATEAALDLYEERHPNVTIHRRWQGYDGYYDGLSTNAAAGDAPDIFQIDENLLSEFATNGITYDLSEFLGDTIEVDALAPGLLETGTVDGQVAGLVAAQNTPGLIYDRTVVQQYGLPEPEIGMSWEELIDWAEQISQASDGQVYGTSDPSHDYKALWVWLRQRGQELYEDGELGFSEADLTEWFQLWAEARASGAAPPPDVSNPAIGGDVSSQLVITQQAATSFMWDNQLSELSEGTDHELGLTAYPGDPSGQWARPSMFWSIYAGSEHAEAAADVINFLINDPEAGQLLGAERGLPPNLDVREQVADSFSEAMQEVVAFEEQMVDQFGDAPSPPPPGHAEVRRLLEDAAQNVQFGRATPAEAAASFFEQAASAISL